MLNLLFMHAIYIKNSPSTHVRIPKTIRRWHSHGLKRNKEMQRLCRPFLTIHIKPITYIYKHYSSNVTSVKHSMGDVAIYVTFLNVKELIQGMHKRIVQFQKLTRNLFLTLHGHNVHGQQQQLSKFLLR